MTLVWADYPSNWAKPGHIPRGHENEAILDRLASLPPQLIAVKTVDETIISNGTYQDDDHLFLTVEAGATYVYNAKGAFSTSATADWRFQFSVPSGTFSAAYFEYFNDTNAMVRASYSNPTTGGTAGFQGKATDSPFEVGGVFTCGVTGGNMTFQWAQDVSNASNTIVRAGSRFTAIRTS